MKSFEVGFWLLIVLATVFCTTEGQLRARRDLRYRQNVAYAYQYRTDQIVGVQKVPVASVHLQNQLLHQVKATKPVHVLHFPTRRPMQAVDQLHTRVDIGQHRRRETVPIVPVVPVLSVVPVVPAGTVVAHSHTEVYRKYR
uniref:Secreted protein n=1 Tax=Anopheles christyi TaxID=43041 RepID=A0A182KHC2_9DIPT